MIKFTTDYNENDVRKVMKSLLLGPRGMRRWLGVVFAVLLVAMLLLNLFILIIQPSALLRLLPGIIVSLVLLLTAVPASRRLYNTLYLTLYGADGKTDYTVDEEGIHCLSATQEAHYRWAYFQKSEIKGDFYCLQGQSQQNILCRISQLSEEDFKTLQDMAAAHIKAK